MEKITLYGLSQEALEIQAILIEADGELTPELEQRLDTLLSQGKSKIEAAAWVVKELQAKADACDLESIRLHNRKATFEADAAKLKARMMIAVDCAFSGKVKTSAFTIWSQTSGLTTSFDVAPDADIRDIDPRFVRTTYALDKQLLKDMVKAGAAVPSGVAVEETPGTRFLRIR